MVLGASTRIDGIEDDAVPRTGPLSSPTVRGFVGKCPVRKGSNREVKKGGHELVLPSPLEGFDSVRGRYIETSSIL